MLHVATVHYRDPGWIDLQLNQLARHVSVPYAVWGSLEGIDGHHRSRFDATLDLRGSHAGKLNCLAAEICAGADAHDHLMFLDGDAFPVADPVPVYLRALRSTSLLAVQRIENLGDVQPHPSFAVTTVGTWRELHGDWSEGGTWTNSAGQEVTDVGGNLLAALQRAGRAWQPLRRSNRVDLHPVWFGVYGDVVYHHGAGFRAPVSRVDLCSADALATRWRHGDVVRGGLHRLWRRVLRGVSARRASKLSAYVYERIRADPAAVWELLYDAALPPGAEAAPRHHGPGADAVGAPTCRMRGPGP